MNPYLSSLREQFYMPRLHVWLQRELLAEFARSIALNELTSPDWREPVYPADDLEFVEFIGWSNSINFHFTDIATKEKFKTLWPECKHCRQQTALYEKIDKYDYRCRAHAQGAKLWSGAFAMDACLMRAVRDDGIPVNQVDFLRDKNKWTLQLARFVFRGMEPVTVIPMLDERHLFLQTSANHLQDFGDSWMNMFRIASYRAFGESLRFPGVVQMLAEKFPSYNDWYHYRTGDLLSPLSFHKRAHLYVQMYEGRARSSTALSRIKDAEYLILPADYELPRALRVVPSPQTPALEYSPEMLKKIVNQEEIEEGSPMEVETRLSTVEAGEIMQEEINAVRKEHGLAPYTKIEIDYFLWTKGRLCQEPHMLVRTTRH